MPREQVLAQHEPFTYKQASEMSGEALHAHKKYEGNLIVKQIELGFNQGMSSRTGFKKGMVLQQANRLSKAEKRKYKKIFQAEEAPEEEVAEEEE
jgi:hypothetical protein